MKEIVDKHDDFIDDVRVSLQDIKGQLGAALKVQHLEGKIAGAVFTAVLGILGLIVSWFKK